MNTLSEYFMVRQHYSSPSRRQQLKFFHRMMRKPDFLRKVCEKGLITEGQAWWFAVMAELFTDLSTPPPEDSKTPAGPWQK
jgi:hypothetical protein